MWRPAASTIAFSVGGAEKVRITSTGLVGIGTTAPASKLSITGAGQTAAAFDTTGSLANVLELDDTGTASGNGGAILFSAATQAWKFAAIKGYILNGSNNSSGDIVFATRPVTTDATLTEAMRIKYTGRLDLQANLNLADATSNTIFYGTAGVAAPGASSAGEKIQLYGTAGTVGANDFALGIESSNMWFNANGGFKWYKAGAIEMVLDTNGQVGIGTASPGYALDVYSNTATSYAIHALSVSNTGTTYSVYAENKSTFNGFAIQGYASGTTGTNFGVDGITVSTGNGSAGVAGSENASSGTTYGVYGQNLSTSGYGVYGWAGASTGTNYGVYGSSNSSAGIGGYFTSSSTGYALITGTGKVGIGTASPSQALDVNGQVHIATFASASATTVCQNAGVLSSCSSSIRYKEKVKDATFGLGDVMKMRPVTFKWKGRDEHDLGFIAEDMEHINPLFVTYKDGQIEGVKYPQLVSVLSKAIQEQQGEIEELKREVRTLQSRR
jgi:Chaperone of endosialidase